MRNTLLVLSAAVLLAGCGQQSPPAVNAQGPGTEKIKEASVTINKPSSAVVTKADVLVNQIEEVAGSDTHIRWNLQDNSGLGCDFDITIVPDSPAAGTSPPSGSGCTTIIQFLDGSFGGNDGNKKKPKWKMKTRGAKACAYYVFKISKGKKAAATCPPAQSTFTVDPWIKSK